MMRPFFLTETPNTFKLQFDYNPRLIDVVKHIPSRPRWDSTDRAWIVQKDDIAYPPNRDARWYVEALAQWAVNSHYCSEIKRRTDTNDITYELPALSTIDGDHYMLLSPYGYQLEGVQYALQHKRCIFGDQPGLGKTLQAICAVVKAHKEASIYGDTSPTLVICPASLKINWQREFKKFAGKNAIILDDSNRDNWHRFLEMKKGDGEPLCDVFITNYESLKSSLLLTSGNTSSSRCGISSLTSVSNCSSRLSSTRATSANHQRPSRANSLRVYARASRGYLN